jgi:hypothetical protein
LVGKYVAKGQTTIEKRNGKKGKEEEGGGRSLAIQKVQPNDEGRKWGTDGKAEEEEGKINSQSTSSNPLPFPLPSPKKVNPRKGLALASIHVCI